MLDRDGYRPNVAIVIVNAKNQVFWGKRVREHSWQFPQGGINPGETPERAMYRELHEEVGLEPKHIRILGRTREWLRYEVPQHWVKREWRKLPRAEADLVSAQARRPRSRRVASRKRTPRIRCVALAGILGAARNRDRIQARSVSTRVDRARALHRRAAQDATRAPVWLPASGDAAFVRRSAVAGRDVSA